jgi:hypothetical protein
LSTPTPDATSPGADADTTAFRLVSIRAAQAPDGNVGRDWLEYCIVQGTNVIKGYRRGDEQAVRVDVEKIVAVLNERRRSLKGSTGVKRGRPPAGAARKEPEDRDE